MASKASLLQLASRAWSGAAGLGLIFFLGNYLDINEQGYFYTFQSLISLQVFFEMGLGQVLLQVASHEFAKVRGGSQSVIDASTNERLLAIVQHAFRWFRNASFLFLFLAAPAGIAYFSFFNDDASQQVAWAGPWLLSCIGQALVLFLMPLLVFREASGAVTEAVFWRFLGELVGYLALFAALYCQLGLYALPILFFVRGLVVLAFCINRSEFVRELTSKVMAPSDQNNFWKREVVPFQRRIAVSWLSGYLLFSSMPMIIFPIMGPEASARFGMTWTALLGIVSLSMALISVRVQSFCALIAQGDMVSLRYHYQRAAKGSFGLALFGVATLIVGLAVASWLNMEIAGRFLPLPEVCMLSIVALANQIVFAQAALVRATKNEPYVTTSVVGGMAQLILTIVGTLFWGLDGLVMLMVAWALLIGLPWGVCIFNAYKPWALDGAIK